MHCVLRIYVLSSYQVLRVRLSPGRIRTCTQGACIVYKTVNTSQGILSMVCVYLSLRRNCNLPVSSDQASVTLLTQSRSAASQSPEDAVSHELCTEASAGSCVHCCLEISNATSQRATEHCLRRGQGAPATVKPHSLLYHSFSRLLF